MALSAQASDTISKAISSSENLLEVSYPVLREIDVVYNSAGGLKTTITQADLDAVPGLSGLTKQQLDDAVYALTQVKTQLETSYTALVQLASRQR
jgi:hypothetical protein